MDINPIYGRRRQDQCLRVVRRVARPNKLSCAEVVNVAPSLRFFKFQISGYSHGSDTLYTIYICKVTYLSIVVCGCIIRGVIIDIRIFEHFSMNLFELIHKAVVLLLLLRVDSLENFFLLSLLIYRRLCIGLLSLQ